MLKYLVEVVQELLPAGIFLALVLTMPYVLHNRGIKKIQRVGFSIGALFAVVMAVLKEYAIIRKYQYLNLVLLAIALLAGLVCCVLFWICVVKKSQAHDTKNAAAEMVLAVVGVVFSDALIIYTVPDVLRMPRRFVWSDQSILSTEFLLKLSGWIFGLLAVFLLILAIYHIVSRLPQKSACSIFTLAFAIHLVVLVENFLSIFIRYRIIKIPVKISSKIVKLVTYETAILFVLLAVLFVTALVWFLFNTRIHGQYQNTAEHRRLRATARNNRRWAILAIALCIFSVVDLTVLSRASQNVVVLSPSEPYQTAGDYVFIPLEQVSDMHLHRFTYTAHDGNAVRFIIVQKQGSSFGVGFDACEICGATGYYERNNEIVCNRCDVVMNRNTIGYKGGCNPIPLAYSIVSGNVRIAISDIELESARFK